MAVEMNTDQGRRVPRDWRGHELLVAVPKSAGGEFVFAQEYLAVTSARVGSDVLDVLFEARSDGPIRLSLVV